MRAQDADIVDVALTAVVEGVDGEGGALELRVITVDDHLPVLKKSNRLMFAQPHGNELWAPSAPQCELGNGPLELGGRHPATKVGARQCAAGSRQ